jgi:hypothetical protein
MFCYRIVFSSWIVSAIAWFEVVKLEVRSHNSTPRDRAQTYRIIRLHTIAPNMSIVIPVYFTFPHLPQHLML